MDLMSGIASLSMEMARAQVTEQYALSLQKKAMELPENGLQEMLASLPQLPKGEYLDIYV